MAILCTGLISLLSFVCASDSDSEIIFHPGLNVFSTPAIIDEDYGLKFSNGGQGISFATLINGKRAPITPNNTNIKPLEGYLVRNDTKNDVTLSINYNRYLEETDNLLSRELSGGWNLVGVTSKSKPFQNIANAEITTIVDFTNSANSNIVKTTKTYNNDETFRDNFVANLGKAYAVFVNKDGGIYGGVNNPNGVEGGESQNYYSEELVSAYERAFENGLITMATIDSANMYGNITRAEMAKLLVNYAKNIMGKEPNTSIPCAFNDTALVQGDLAPAIVEACQLGIMGQNSTEFRPFDLITRAEFGTYLSRLLWGNEYEGGTPYYAKHLNALKTAGIMTQITNAEEIVEIKGYVLIILQRVAQIYKDEQNEKCGILTYMICHEDPENQLCPAICKPISGEALKIELIESSQERVEIIGPEYTAQKYKISSNNGDEIAIDGFDLQVELDETLNLQDYINSIYIEINNEIIEPTTRLVVAEAGTNKGSIFYSIPETTIGGDGTNTIEVVIKVNTTNGGPIGKSKMKLGVMRAGIFYRGNDYGHMFTQQYENVVLKFRSEDREGDKTNFTMKVDANPNYESLDLNEIKVYDTNGNEYLPNSQSIQLTKKSGMEYLSNAFNLYFDNLEEPVSIESITYTYSGYTIGGRTETGFVRINKAPSHLNFELVERDNYYYATILGKDICYEYALECGVGHEVCPQECRKGKITSYELTTSNKTNTVHLSQPNPDIGKFSVKSVRGDKINLKYIMLSINNEIIDINNQPINIDSTSFKVTINDKEATFKDENLDMGRFFYSVPEGTNISGDDEAIISITMNDEPRGIVDLSLKVISNDYYGVQQAYKIRFEPALVYITNKEVFDNYTNFTFAIDTSDNSIDVSNLTLYDNNDNSIINLPQPITNTAPIQIDNGEEAKTIDKISYDYTLNDTTTNIEISKEDYNDYFKIWEEGGEEREYRKIEKSKDN